MAIAFPVMPPLVQVVVRAHNPQPVTLNYYVNYQLKFYQLKKKINQDLGISPFRQVLSVHLPTEGNIQVIEDENLNRSLAIYYSDVKKFLEVTVTVKPERSDHQLMLSYYYLDADETVKTGVVTVDEDDTVMTFKNAICCLRGLKEEFYCFSDLGYDDKGKSVFEQMEDAYMISYYFKRGRTNKALLEFIPESSSSGGVSSPSGTADSSNPGGVSSPSNSMDPREAAAKIESCLMDLFWVVDSQEGIMLGDLDLNSNGDSQEGDVEDTANEE